MPAAKGTAPPLTYALVLGGQEATLLSGVSGGNIRGQVQEVAGRPQWYVKKHLSGIQYEDFTIQVGVAMTGGLAGWINESWRGRPARVDGSIVACDFDLNVKAERAFSQALITEASFPALDASSKDPGLLTVRFRPARIEAKKGDGKLSGGQLSKQKLWQSANFRLEVDGLSTSGVVKVDPFTLAQRSGPRGAARIEFPNLKVWLDQAHSQDWQDWFEDFVVSGNSGEDQERDGALVFLSPDMRAELGRISLHHLGIVALSVETAPIKETGRLAAELYCELMDVRLGEGSA